MKRVLTRCITGKFDGTSLLNKKALRANDAHSREDEECRRRPRETPECAKAHSFLLVSIHQEIPIAGIRAEQSKKELDLK